MATAAQKKEFLDQAKKHYAADMLLKGTYGNDENGFKGCSVGCHLHHINPDMSADDIEYFDGKHKIVADYYGYPEWLARLQDTVFEGIPQGENNLWHVKFAETLSKLPDDYNWQAALHRVHAAILRISYRTAGTAQQVVQTVIDLHERASRGEIIEDDAWSAAWSAARSAAWSASSAAESSAWSAAASAAWSAASSAAWSEAWSAASSAASSAAWSAAASAAFQEIRDDVLQAIAA